MKIPRLTLSFQEIIDKNNGKYKVSFTSFCKFWIFMIREICKVAKYTTVFISQECGGGKKWMMQGKASRLVEYITPRLTWKLGLDNQLTLLQICSVYQLHGSKFLFKIILWFICIMLVYITIINKIKKKNLFSVELKYNYSKYMIWSHQHHSQNLYQTY